MKKKSLTIEEVHRTILKVKSQLKAGPRGISIDDLGGAVALYGYRSLPAGHTQQTGH